MKRDAVKQEDRWNVEALYPNLEAWKKDFEKAIGGEIPPKWPAIAALKGTLGQSAAQLKKGLDETLKLSEWLERLYTWAHLRHDEDIANNDYKTAFIQVMGVLHTFQEHIAWFEPELLALREKTIQSYLSDPVLAPYRFHLEKIFRLKPHTLSPEKEMLLAQSQKALQTFYKAFNALTDADFKFESVEDSEGKIHPLTQAQYSLLLRSPDRTLRKNAFTTYQSHFMGFENSIAELLAGQVEANIFNARARNYPSALDAALYPHNIPTAVYHSLIEAVNAKLPILHRYLKLRKEILNVDKLHLYDVYVPLLPDYDLKIPYSEAEKLVTDSVAPLGAEYQNFLKEGLKTNRWVDRFENENKRSGAYSSGCYGSYPYILMNYKETLRDASTLAHEAGHSMHSLYSRAHQPYYYSDYSIFVAEVASTFNEELLSQQLLSQTDDPLQKAFIINQKIEDIRGTLFRQTMFAEFELKIHTLAENNTPLTPQLLKQEFYQLNQKYFGLDVEVDAIIAIEWARIPHFYASFYVYQYATGISAALSLADHVTGGSDKELQAYLSFLKGGCSQFPVQLLQQAGVDMATPEPVIKAIDKFDQLTTELEKTLLKS